MTLQVTDATFEQEVLQSDVPVLLDFWAPWCGPCRMVAPILDELSEEFAGRAKIAKVNVDENQQIPAQFGIRSIPTLILFKNGQVTSKEDVVELQERFETNDIERILLTLLKGENEND